LTRAAQRDGSEEQLSAEAPASEMGGDYGSRFLGGGAGIEENDDRGAGAAERCAEDAWFTGQFLQTRKQGAEWSAVRLVDAVFERGGEQVVNPLAEGREQEH